MPGHFRPSGTMGILPAQSRAESDSLPRPGCSGFYPVGAGNLPWGKMAPSPWALAPLSCHSQEEKSFPLCTASLALLSSLLDETQDFLHRAASSPPASLLGLCLPRTGRHRPPATGGRESRQPLPPASPGRSECQALSSHLLGKSKDSIFFSDWFNKLRILPQIFSFFSWSVIHKINWDELHSYKLQKSLILINKGGLAIWLPFPEVQPLIHMMLFRPTACQCDVISRRDTLARWHCADTGVQEVMHLVILFI